MNEKKKTIRIDFWKAIIVVAIAFLSGAGGGIWGAMVTINSDHYALATNIEDTKELKENYKTLLTYIGNINTAIGEIKGELKNQNIPSCK